MIGTKINAVENSLGIDYSNPVNILHVGRSYGPCIACAVHTLDLTGKNAPGILRDQSKITSSIFVYDSLTTEHTEGHGSRPDGR